MARASWPVAMAFIVGVVVVSGCALAPTSTPIAATASPTRAECLRAEYKANPADGQPPAAGDMSLARDIIERRVNSTGVAGPVVRTQSTDRIIVELPGVTESDAGAFRQLIGSAGRLEFVPIPASTTPPPSETTIDTSLTVLFGVEELASAGADLDTADLGPGERAIAFALKDNGARLLADYTTHHIGENIAIVLDGTVISAPVVQAPILDGKGRIEGEFSETEQNNLVTVLKYGALPFPLTEVAQVSCGQVSPS